MWVISKDSRGYAQVGYFKPDGTFYVHEDSILMVSEAELKVAYLNGGVLHIALEDHLRDIAQHLEQIYEVVALTMRGTVR